MSGNREGEFVALEVEVSVVGCEPKKRITNMKESIFYIIYTNWLYVDSSEDAFVG